MLRKLTFLLTTLTLLFTACSGTASKSAPALEASGVIEATEIIIAPEVGGIVAEVFVSEGSNVQTGDPLFRLQNDLLEAQVHQAQAAVESAQAGLDAVKTNLDLAQVNLEAAQAGLQAAQAQYDLVLQAARTAEYPKRLANWQTNPPNTFELPLWYFTKDEKIKAAEDELKAAQEALQDKQDAYQSVLTDIGESDIQAAEERLVNARAAFEVADNLYQRRIATNNGKTTISDYVKNLHDAAKSELDAAQRAYDQLLTTEDAQSLLEARSNVAVAEERVQTALDRLNSLKTSDLSPTVVAAQATVSQAETIVKQGEIGIKQAENAITQAEKGLAQAQAALDALQIQKGKLTVYAPIDGVVTTRSIEVGELAQPGMGALTMAQLASLSVTVYIPEDRYGEVTLGQTATLMVDSFPDKTFPATVSYISDRAEYTPRNVQTKEERQNTVYAVKLHVENAGGNLKPGMPADVTFTP